MKFSTYSTLLSLSLASTLSANTLPSDVIKICQNSQYEEIALSAISKVKVSLVGDYWLPDSSDFEGEYTGSQALEVLAPLNLHAPDRPGYAATILTGEIVLYFRTDTNEDRTKTLSIGNNRLVQDQDSDCEDVVYYPEIVLDRSWLPQE